MKTKIKYLICCIMASFLITGWTANQTTAGTLSRSSYKAAVPVSIDIFYRSLSPYGRWVSYPQYGQVWIPDVGAGFSPYSTNGHWVYTDYGWTWASDYSWGWAPFHYGRWLMDDYYGWIWVPGTEWAPAWVAWRNSSDYYGWAPLSPGVNISINIGIPTARWIFIPRRYFGNPYGYRYYVPRQRNVYIIHNTTIINNTHVYRNNRYFSGPRRVEVEHSTNRSIRPVRVFNAERPGVTRVNNRQISIYRPTVEHGSSSRVATRPANNNRPEAARGSQSRQQSPSARQNNPQNSSTRVFRGQENNRAHTPANAPQQTRSRVEQTPSRSSAPARHQQSQRPPQQSRQTSPRSFNQQSQRPSSRRAASTERPRAVRSSSSQRAAAVHSERSAPRSVSHENSRNHNSRSGRR